jgi:hypothetical protein
MTNSTSIRALTLGAVALAALAAFPDAAAAVPASVPIQGVLTDSAGAPLAGPQQLRLRIYAAASGGTALHDESQVVMTAAGTFTAYLGTTATLDLSLFGDGDVWLGVTVGTDEEMLPRLAIGSVPFAAHAAVADECRSVPAGAIMFFDVACPAGWEPYAALNGRVPVGGTPGVSAGAPLANGGTRTITASQLPAHTHPIPALSGATTAAGGSHTHSGTTGASNVSLDLSSGGYSTTYAQGAAFNAGLNDLNQTAPADSHSHSVSLSGGDHTHSIQTTTSNTLANSGPSSVDVTMPYLQLRACRKM